MTNAVLPVIAVVLGPTKLLPVLAQLTRFDPDIVHAVIICTPPVGPLEINAVVPDIVMPLGMLNEYDGDVVIVVHVPKDVPLIGHSMTEFEAALTTYAVDPLIPIPKGPLNPEAALVQPVKLVPDIVHPVTVLSFEFVTNIVDPVMAIPYGYAKFGGMAGMAAKPVAEHVYFVFEFNKYVTTVKHLYVTPFVNDDTAMGDKDDWAVVGCRAPVPVAKGLHTVADEAKHCT